MEENTEATTTKRTRKQAPKGPAVETPKPKAQIYAKARYNHKPTDGDIQALAPRLLQPLAVQAVANGRTLADGVIGIRTTQDADGNYEVMATLELVSL